MHDLQPTQWPASLIAQGLKSDMLVSGVYVNSPAEALGIKSGWHLLEVDMAPPDPYFCRALRRIGVKGMAFYNPEDGSVHTLGPGPWPLGLELELRFNDSIIEQAQNRDLPPDAFWQLWTRPDWRDLAALLGPVEKSLTSGLGRLFSRGRPDRAKLAAAASNFELLLLSFCNLASGHKEDAVFFLDARRKALEATELQRDLACNFALEHFIDAILLREDGQRDAARDAADRMLDIAPRIEGVMKAYCRLTGSDPLIFWPEEMRQPFPMPYTLPQHDPFGQWPDGGTVTLQDALTQMDPDQFLFVYVLGLYRTNGPMQDEMEALIATYIFNPDRIAGIHIITSIDNPQSHWLDNNGIEDEAREAGLPVQILFDAPDQLARDLRVSSLPTLYILDHKSRVLSMKTIEDESGYWQALSEMRELG